MDENKLWFEIIFSDLRIYGEIKFRILMVLKLNPQEIPHCQIFVIGRMGTVWNVLCVAGVLGFGVV